MYLIIVLSAAAFLTAIISAVIGMAGGIVLLSFMTFFMTLETIVPIHGLVQLASNTSRTLGLLQHVERRILLPMAVGLPFGTLFGTWLLGKIVNREVFYLMVAALIFYVLFKPKRMPKLQIPFWGFGILGLAVGALNPIVGATGPLQAPFFLRDDLTKEQIVASKASVQTLGHLLKIPAFLYLGFDYSEYALLTTLMVIGVIAGTRVGIRILRVLSEGWFRGIYRTALFAAAVRVLYKAVHPNLVSLSFF